MGAKGFLNWLLKALGQVLVGSAIGVITMSALVAYDSGQPPPILGAKWWEVLTALGTVGAAVGAVWISYKNQRKNEKEKILEKTYYLEGVVLLTLSTMHSNLGDPQILTTRDPDSALQYLSSEIAKLDAISTSSIVRDEIALLAKISQAKTDMEKLSRKVKRGWIAGDLHFFKRSRGSVEEARVVAQDITNKINRKL